jgi:hypothetical protein
LLIASAHFAHETSLAICSRSVKPKNGDPLAESQFSLEDINRVRESVLAKRAAHDHAFPQTCCQ